MTLHFAVRGIPVAQGSPRAFVAGGRAIVATERARGFGGRSAPLAAWRNAIATEARAAIGELPFLTGAVRVELAFSWPRPAGHFGKHGLLPSAPAAKTTKPDIDKATRAALDALTGVVWRDDVQVVRLAASKGYSETPGVEIIVEELA